VVLPPETKLSSLLVVDSGVDGHADLALAFAGTAEEGVLLAGRWMHAALNCARNFGFVIWWVRVRCCPSRVIMAPHNLYVDWKRRTFLELHLFPLTLETASVLCIKVTL